MRGVEELGGVYYKGVIIGIWYRVVEGVDFIVYVKLRLVMKFEG